MAKITLNDGSAYLKKLERLASASTVDAMTKKAIYPGAGIAVEAIKKEIEAIPTEDWRHLQPGEQFNGITEFQKAALQVGYGIADMEKDKNGDWNTKIGVKGYVNDPPTKKYPRGTPLPMLARSLELGTEIRKKHPFVRRAVNRSRPQVIQAMGQVIDEETKKIMKK